MFSSTFRHVKIIYVITLHTNPVSLMYKYLIILKIRKIVLCALNKFIKFPFKYLFLMEKCWIQKNVENLFFFPSAILDVLPSSIYKSFFSVDTNSFPPKSSTFFPSSWNVRKRIEIAGKLLSSYLRNEKDIKRPTFT